VVYEYHTKENLQTAIIFFQRSEISKIVACK